MAVSYGDLRSQVYALMRQEGDPWTILQASRMLGVPEEIISRIMNELADSGHLKRVRARTFRWCEGGPARLIKTRTTMVTLSTAEFGKLLASFADRYEAMPGASTGEAMELLALHLETHLDGVGNLREAYRAARGN